VLYYLSIYNYACTVVELGLEKAYVLRATAKDDKTSDTKNAM